MPKLTNILNPIKRIFAVKEYIAAVDTFAAPGESDVYFSGNSPMSSFTLQVKEIGGAATDWQVQLLGSLTGVADEFDTILTHTKEDIGNGKPIFSGTNLFPCLHFKIKVVSLTLGAATAIEVKSLGTN